MTQLLKLSDVDFKTYYRYVQGFISRCMCQQIGHLSNDLEIIFRKEIFSAELKVSQQKLSSLWKREQKFGDNK